MKTINACLFVTITLFGLISSIDFSTIQELQELKQSTFASSLIETISLSLQSNTGSESTEVLKMLTDLANQLNQDQTNDDATFNNKNNEFERHINALKAEIEKLYQEIELLSSKIADLTKLISVATKNIQAFNDRITNLRLEVVQLNNTFQKDTEYFTERISSLGRVQQTLLNTIVKLNALNGSVSGQNRPDHVNQTSAEKRDSEWLNKNVKSFLQADEEVKEGEYDNFLELTLNADQNALNTLTNLIKKIADDVLIKKITAEKYVLEFTEIYNQSLSAVRREKKLNKQALLKQTENKNIYENQRANLEKEKLQKEQRRNSLEKELKLNQDLQKKLSEVHIMEKQERQNETDIVNKLIKIVETRLVGKKF